MNGTIRLGKACIGEHEKDIIEYYNYFLKI